MPRNKKRTNSAPGSRWPRTEPGSSNRQFSRPAYPNGTGGRLQLPPGKPEIDALRSVTREWLVPRLVEKFLRLHGVELNHSRKLPNIANTPHPRLPGQLASTGDERSGTPLATARAGSKKLDRRRTRKRTIGH